MSLEAKNHMFTTSCRKTSGGQKQNKIVTKSHPRYYYMELKQQIAFTDTRIDTMTKTIEGIRNNNFGRWK